MVATHVMNDTAGSAAGLSARRRLDQAYELWHRALTAYPDVDPFCLEINSLIQALRSVTWLLQKALRHEDGFEDWYRPWQDTMRGDLVMRWLVKARNQIEKEGDLELRSTARVSVIASWLPAPYDEFDVPPLLPPHAIAAALAAREIPKELREEGVLKVERRWVTASLSDVELLEACAHAYSELDALLSDAETRFGKNRARLEARPGGRPTTMVAGPDLRSAFLHLSSGQFLEVETSHPPIDPDGDIKVRDRYGNLFDKPFPGASLDERVRSHHEIGRRMLEIDGHHQTIAILLRGGRRVGINALQAGDQQEKYLMMEALAQDVLQRDADEVILSTEVWMAVALQADDPQAQKRAGDRMDRSEAFVTYGVSRQGPNLTVMTPFSREGERIRLGVSHTDTTVPQALLPILRAWR